MVRVWDTRTSKLIESFSGHRDLVSCLCFRVNSHMLFSGSFDRSIKHWNLDEMGYIETLYGHTDHVMGIDMRTAERAITCGRDRSLRLWKIPEESQLVYNGKGVMDCVAMVTGEDSVSGSDDGVISMWHVSKKKATFTLPKAHGAAGVCSPIAIAFVHSLTVSLTPPFPSPPLSPSLPPLRSLAPFLPSALSLPSSPPLSLSFVDQFHLLLAFLGLGALWIERWGCAVVEGRYRQAEVALRGED
jgi:WD40 repeat protein